MILARRRALVATAAGRMVRALAEIRGKAGGAEDYQAQAILADFGLDPEKSTQGLSGGECRRAAL